jgi:hypothetical protein
MAQPTSEPKRETILERFIRELREAGISSGSEKQMSDEEVKVYRSIIRD